VGASTDLAALLKKHALGGAALSDDSSLDGREPPLNGAIAAIEWSGSSVLTCIPGRLAYYIGENGARDRRLLER
jgi:hypothetical protein